MALTHTTHTMLVAMAGSTYDWATTPGHRPTSDVRQGLRMWLAAMQGDRCAACGDTLGEGWELSHVVSGGAARKGFVPGNIFAGCRACNEIDAENGPVIAFNSILFANLIPTEWPATTVLRDMGIAAKEEFTNRKNSRRKARGM